MKANRIFSILLLAVLLLSNYNFCQDKSDIKSVLAGIIDLSKAKKYDEAVKYIAFCSDDKKKVYNAPILTNKDQVNYTKRIAKRIGALAEVSTSYNIGDVSLEKTGTVEYQKVSVEFVSGTQKMITIFKFLTLNGKPLLAEID